MTPAVVLDLNSLTIRRFFEWLTELHVHDAYKNQNSVFVRKLTGARACVDLDFFTIRRSLKEWAQFDRYDAYKDHNPVCMFVSQPLPLVMLYWIGGV